MSLVALALTSMLATPFRAEPVLWLHPQGNVLVNGAPVRGQLNPGAQMVRTPYGMGLDLNGKRGGLLLGDRAELRLSRSFTASTWIYLRNYVSDGPGAQILFRGDDRSEYDPYHLTIIPSGNVQWGFDSADHSRSSIETEIPLKRWVHVTGSFDAGTGELRLYLGDRLMASRITDHRSFEQLIPEYTPGVGIGNVQNNRGPHNQPLNGMLVDLRLYDQALEPSEVGYKPGLDVRTP